MPSFDITLTVTLTDEQLQRLTQECSLDNPYQAPREVALWLTDDVLCGTNLEQAVEEIDFKRASVIRKRK